MPPEPRERKPCSTPAPAAAIVRRMLNELRRLFEHARWADGLLLGALRASPDTPAEAWREFAHVQGAFETWLSRLEGRAARLPVWPALEPQQLPAECERIHSAYAAYLARIGETELERLMAYTTSAGVAFESRVIDMLLQAATHGQYHRGKMNVLLRQAGLAPAPDDFIAFVRGAPAATTPPTR